jgi:hypothetical protein
MGKQYLVTDCIEHPEKNRSVDIIRQQDGRYRFQEWRRDREDIAIRAAEHAINWLKKL